MRALALVPALLTACSANHKPAYCGDSFCLEHTDLPVAKTTPVEDFNVYLVIEGGKQFVIYEGNHPMRADTAALQSVSVDRGFAGASLLKSTNGPIVLIRTRKADWPTHLEITAGTGTPSDVTQFVTLMHPRQ